MAEPPTEFPVVLPELTIEQKVEKLPSPYKEVAILNLRGIRNTKQRIEATEQLLTITKNVEKLEGMMQMLIMTKLNLKQLQQSLDNIFEDNKV